MLTHRPKQSADRDFEVFPRTLAEVLDRSHVREAHVSLTQGRWRYSHWGMPVSAAPTGGELWAWFTDDTELSEYVPFVWM